MKGSAIKDFLLFCLRFLADALLNIGGTIIGGLGFVLVIGGFTIETWPVTILGVPILLLGLWMQNRT